jgi:hypothetical protein
LRRVAILSAVEQPRAGPSAVLGLVVGGFVVRCGRGHAQYEGGFGHGGRLTRLPTLRSRIGAQPQRNVGGLRSLFNHAYQVVVQRIEARLVPQLYLPTAG